jgi:protein phosphatase 1L
MSYSTSKYKQIPSRAFAGQKKDTRLPFLQGSGRAQLRRQANQAHGVSSVKGRRNYMEDEYQTVYDLASGASGGMATNYWGVFDGHAGGRASKACARDLHNYVADAPSFGTSLHSAVNHGFQLMENNFMKTAASYKMEDGTTAITMFQRGNQLIVANVGDSRAVMCSGGEAVGLSIDHKPTRPSERRRIVAGGGTVIHCNGAARVNGCLSTSRAIGDRSLKPHVSPEPELKEWQLTPKDEFVILASDGLWDVFNNEEAVEFVRKIKPNCTLDQCAKQLVSRAMTKGSMDNVTAVVVSLQDLPAEPTMSATPVSARNATEQSFGSAAVGSATTPNSARQLSSTSNSYTNGPNSARQLSSTAHLRNEARNDFTQLPTSPMHVAGKGKPNIQHLWQDTPGGQSPWQVQIDTKNKKPGASTAGNMSPMVMRGGQSGGRGRGGGKQGFSSAQRQQTLQRTREQIYGARGQVPGGGAGGRARGSRGGGVAGGRGRGGSTVSENQMVSPRQNMQSAPASTAVGFSGRLRTTGNGGRKVSRQSQYGQRSGPSAPSNGAASSGFYASRPASK